MATDPDLPANALTYSLIGAPVGATIDPGTGVFSWTPTEAQGPGIYPFTVRVTDDGTPSLDSAQPVVLTVTTPVPVNRLPVVTVVPLATSLGTTLVGATAATFSDADSGQGTDSFTALIDFGDHTPTVAGTIVADGFLFRVTADHTFSRVGTFPVTVTVTDRLAGTVTATGAVMVSPPAVVLGGSLDSGSDTGASSSDGITNDDTPSFDGSAPPGFLVQLYAQPANATAPGADTVRSLLGLATADPGGRYRITSFPIPDGDYVVTAMATSPDGRMVLTATIGPLVIDTIGPRVTGVVLNPRTGRIVITYQDERSGLSPATVGSTANYQVVRPISSRRVRILPVTGMTTPLSPPAAQRVVTLTLNRRLRVAPGRLRLIARTQGITDLAGNALDGEFAGSFPSGDGQRGGDFAALFRVRGRWLSMPRPFFASVRSSRPAGPLSLLNVARLRVP